MKTTVCVLTFEDGDIMGIFSTYANAVKFRKAYMKHWEIGKANENDYLIEEVVLDQAFKDSDLYEEFT